MFRGFSCLSWFLGWRSFGGIEDFLATRITREHKDGHVFLVFVVCVCFVAEQGSERRREEGVSEFRSFGGGPIKKNFASLRLCARSSLP